MLRTKGIEYFVALGDTPNASEISGEPKKALRINSAGNGLEITHLTIEDGDDTDVVLGAGASGTLNSVAIGKDASSSSAGVAIGVEADSNVAGDNAVAIGCQASSSALGVAIGDNASAGIQAIAVGASVESGNYIEKFGHGYENDHLNDEMTLKGSISLPAVSSGVEENIGLNADGAIISLGENSLLNLSDFPDISGGAKKALRINADGDGIEVSHLTISDGSSSNVCLGPNSSALDTGGIAIGNNSTASNGAAISVGLDSSAGSASIAVGNTAVAGNQSICIGTSLTAANNVEKFGSGYENNNSTDVMTLHGGIVTPDVAAGTPERFLVLDSSNNVKTVVWGDPNVILETPEDPQDPIDFPMLGYDINAGEWKVGGLNVDQLADTDITSIADGDVLRYNSTSTNWENEKLELDALDDVVIGTPSNNQVIKHNGTNWVNAGLAIHQLTNVDAASPSDNQILRYNSSSTNWENETLAAIPTSLDDLTDAESDSTNLQLGQNAFVGTGTKRVAVGAESRANSQEGVAVGYDASSGLKSVAIGCESLAAFNSIAIGYQVNASSNEEKFGSGYLYNHDSEDMTLAEDLTLSGYTGSGTQLLQVDNSGVVTGTDKITLDSGSWTPSTSNLTNVSLGSAGLEGRYLRVGDTVRAEIIIHNIDVTTTNTASIIHISLPVDPTANFNANSDLFGSGIVVANLGGGDADNDALTVQANNGAKTAILSWYDTTGNSSRSIFANFMYSIQ